ncbi:site-specific DNA-methyltransferase [Lysinibacillus sp. BPa_S21]|uniref:site-specific DNA-methyltransferase n=1 Tax=Lysinibacillus sp. BPa_S21 TaxID=2932478 RepID=UPI0020135818|nr:site-specific DNA-methyltransferase [Lysinibacillus sp. BPa_S21]MCL1697329.1 site-specific DNA-methyltransferase [Lysinibacillus sp. BPa_S21]
MKNKLELTWFGKDEKMSVEPRLLIENNNLSNIQEDPDTENFIIHGDNLLALKALENKYAGKIKCIYIDPPYNINAANEHYDDFVEHSKWLKLMKARLEILRRLLAPEGSIWIQIDDEEMAYLKVLCDEVFKRCNYVNTLSVNMKNVAGVSGGGEDKRLKKNCEYILVYARDYSKMPTFKPQYIYTEMSDLIDQYLKEKKSWKYTTVLVDPGQKEYFGSTVDGDGNEIKVYLRKNVVTMSVNQIARRDGITIKEAYKKYGINVFRTTNAQSSIRTRVMDYRKEQDIKESIISIEYVPKTGKNKGVVYEQFYKDDKCNLFVWLRDTSEVIDGELYKRDLLGTYWDMNAWMKNVTKEGGVKFPNSKKPEQLIRTILEMTTEPNDIVLDSFLGSGTTAAVAHKMGRRYIGIEMGDHAYSHCKPRLDSVIAGEDDAGITKSADWSSGGGYRFYELAPSLINTDGFGETIINKEYNADMLASAVALHEGFIYQPSSELFWKQSKGSDNSYLFVTTKHVTKNLLDAIRGTMEDEEYLIVACCSYDLGIDKTYSNIVIKKIPQMLLNNCEFDKADYNLNIINPPVFINEDDDEESDSDE